MSFKSPEEFKAFKAILFYLNSGYFDNDINNLKRAINTMIHLRDKTKIFKNIKKGEIFTENNVQSKRPAFGLHTRNYELVLGKKAKRDIKKGTPLIGDYIDA